MWGMYKTKILQFRINKIIVFNDKLDEEHFCNTAPPHGSPSSASCIQGMLDM
jgi:hypothetical protein